MASPKRPQGEPDADCFELKKNEIPEPAPGEVLVRDNYLSVDPYMRGRMRASKSCAEPWAVGDVIKGGVVGEVVDSASDKYSEADLITGEGGWADYGCFDADDIAPLSLSR